MRVRGRRRLVALVVAVCGALAVGPLPDAEASDPSAVAPSTWVGTRVAGHRGLGAQVGGRARVAGAPEESLPALRTAARRGYVVELDVRFTSDHVPVAIHDASTTRTMTCPGLSIADSTYAGLVSRCDLAGMAGLAERDLATWDAVLAAVEPYRATVVVEIKAAPSAEEARAVVAAILHHGMAERIVVNSFTPTNISAITTAAATQHVTGLRTGLLTTGTPSAATVRAAAGPAAMMVAPRAERVTAAWVQQMHAGGLQVWAWTPDTAAQWQQLKRMRVDVLITNVPAAATATLPWGVPRPRVTALGTPRGGLVFHLPPLPAGATRWRIWNGSSVRETAASTYTWVGGRPGRRHWAVAARDGRHVGAYRRGTLTLSGRPAAPTRPRSYRVAGRLRLRWTAPASTTMHPRRSFQVRYGGRTYGTTRSHLDLAWRRPRGGRVGGFAVRSIGRYGASRWVQVPARHR